MADTVHGERSGGGIPLGLLTAVGTILALVWWLRVLRTAGGLGFAGIDVLTYMYPMLERGFADLGEGKLFLWNPYQLVGLPGLATLQPGYLYPPNLIYLILPTTTGMAVATFSHVALGTYLTIVLGREMGLRWEGASLAGLSFGLTHLLSSIYTMPFLMAVAWMPLGMVATRRILRGGGRRWYVAMWLAVALPILAGGYQHAVYVLYANGLFTGITGVAMLWRADTRAATLWRLLAVGGSVVLGLALAAPQILPTLEFARQGASRTSAALSTEQVLVFGALRVLGAKALLTLAVVRGEELSALYVGLLPLAFAVAGLTVRRPTFQAVGLAFVAWGTVALWTPDWYIEVRKLLYPLGWFRLPLRAFFIAQFGVALLAGLGLDAMLGHRRLPRPRWLAPALVAVLAAALSVVRPWTATFWTGPAFVLVCGVAWRYQGRFRNAVLVAVVTAILLADSVGSSANRVGLPYAGDGLAPLEARRPMLETVREQAGRSRTLLLLPDLFAKTAMVVGLYDISDYQPLAMRPHADFFTYAASGRRFVPGTDRFGGAFEVSSDPDAAARQRRFLDLLSVGLVVTHPARTRSPAFRAFARDMVPLDLAAPGSNATRTVALRNPTALPRAYGVYDAECPATAERRLARLAAVTFDPRDTVVLEDGCREGPTVRGASPAVTIVRYEHDRVELVAEMERPGWIVLTDSYYPGWHATVDGNPHPVLRANTLVRAVHVPAGRSEIEFRYVPTLLYQGVGVALVALLGGFGLLALIRS